MVVIIASDMVISLIGLILLHSDSQLLQEFFFDLSPAYLYIIVEYQIST